MKVLYYVVRSLIALVLSCTVAAPGLNYRFAENDRQGYDVKVMTFNVYIAGVGKKSPKNRGKLVAKTIRDEMPDSFGLQEADIAWVERVSAAMPEYSYVGVGRDDGAKKGEFSPVFYLKDKYKVVDSGTFWFSPSPDTPSRGWDAMCRRICSWAVLENKQSGERYAHFNAHLDNAGSISRSKSADILLEKIAEYSQGLPTVITGDFNCKEGTKPYQKIVEGGFADCKYSAEKTMSMGTWHNFGMNKTEGGSPIDFVFTSYGSANVKSYRVITDKVYGAYPSDHYPVVCEMTLFSEPSAEQIRAMTFNILCWGDDYNVFKRIAPITQTITKAAPDVFGVQEATPLWMAILKAEYEDVYSSVGVGRDGGFRGEFSAVFYRTDKFNLIDSGTFWLSDTPDKPSKLENSAYTRICTYALLEAKSSGKRFVFVNTHLDYVDSDTMVQQVNMVLDKADSFGVPTIMTGDFNSKPDSDIYAAVCSRGYSDTRTVAKLSDSVGTYTDFNPDTSKAEIIDYIFCKEFDVQTFNVMDEVCENGRYASDHFAAYADLSI